jgi:hypothetical protein
LVIVNATKEIIIYKDVTPADNGSKSVFLGGYSSVFDINPQVNQNLTGDNVANIQAAPTAQGNGSFHFKARDYGVIIGLYRITPQLDYAQLGLDRKLLMTDAADYPIPELDSIGMQETLPSEIYTTDIGTLFSRILSYSALAALNFSCFSASSSAAWRLSSSDLAADNLSESQGRKRFPVGTSETSTFGCCIRERKALITLASSIFFLILRSV